MSQLNFSLTRCLSIRRLTTTISTWFHSYYRQFNLYKYIFGERVRLITRQVNVQEVEDPTGPMFSLNSGFPIADPAVAESTGEHYHDASELIQT
jgi:hypothetical protein